MIKNVAGYDVSRLMVGALGTLGLITEVSLKVLPKPAAEITLQFELDEADRYPENEPVGGAAAAAVGDLWHAGLLTLRLSGAVSAVHAAQAKLGGETLKDAAAFWQRLRDQSTPFFDLRPATSNQSLWRLAVKPTTPAAQAGRYAMDRVGRRGALAGQRPARRRTVRSSAKAAVGMPPCSAAKP